MNQDMQTATRAYAASAAHRDPRAQEADAFRRTVGALRAAREAGDVQRARALADNFRLWALVEDLMRDPANALPVDLRASILSVGLAVRREMAQEAPDFDFLIAVNENMAAGLSAAA
jgi:flagellar biosynthesis regulator FlaF